MSQAALRIVLVALVISILTVVGATAWLVSEINSGTGSRTIFTNVQIGGPFTLTDHTGNQVRNTDFHDRFMLIYFGYTHCPDVCPTELASMATALDILGPQAESIVPLFITLDPQRDTPAALASYVPLFHERLVGLTGTEAEVAVVAQAYSVFYEKIEGEETTDYTLKHTTLIYLVRPDGELAESFPNGTAPTAISDAIRRQVPSVPAG